MQGAAVLMWVVMVGLALIQIAAFQQGMEDWLGLHWLFSTFIWFAVMAIPFGTLLTAGVAFYGITAGWGWEWWQALLLLFPFVGLAMVLGVAQGVMGLAGMLSRGRQE